jgi:hypothetical protein
VKHGKTYHHSKTSKPPKAMTYTKQQYLCLEHPQGLSCRSQRGRQYGPQGFYYISLRTIYFPSKLTEEEMTIVFNIPGFSHVSGSFMNTNHGRSIIAETWKSRIEGEVEFDGQSARAMIVGYWWNGWEMWKNYWNGESRSGTRSCMIRMGL